MGLYHWLNLNKVSGVMVYALRGSDRYLAYSSISLEHALWQIVEDVVVESSDKGTSLGRMKPYNSPNSKIKNKLAMRNVGGVLKCSSVKIATPEWMIFTGSQSRSTTAKRLKQAGYKDTEHIYNWPFGFLEEEKDE